MSRILLPGDKKQSYFLQSVIYNATVSQKVLRQTDLSSPLPDYNCQKQDWSKVLLSSCSVDQRPPALNKTNLQVSVQSSRSVRPCRGLDHRALRQEQLCCTQTAHVDLRSVWSLEALERSQHTPLWGNTESSVQYVTPTLFMVPTKFISWSLQVLIIPF